MQQQRRRLTRTEEDETIWAVINDGWLQLAIGSLVAMYVIGDLFS
jgi:hypothetical protein